jgi:hypothetical protein
MEPEFWQYAVPALVTALAAVITVWLTSRRTNQKVDEATAYAKPTGNGFANEVREGLKLIQAEQNRQAVHIAKLDGTVSVLSSVLLPAPRVRQDTE